MARPAFLFDSRLADAVPIASTTEPTGDFNVLNLRDWAAFTFWKPTALPATVTVDSGAAQTADYAVIWGHDLGTQGATLKIRGSTDNFVVSDVEVATVTPADDKPFALYFASQSFRYWRIEITGTTVPTLAIAALGDLLEVPAGLPQGFDPTRREPRGPFSRSVEGHPLGRALFFEHWEADLRFRFVTWDWLRNTFVPAWNDHLRGTPFVFAWDRVTYPAEIFLVNNTRGFTSPHRTGPVVELGLRVQGLALA